MSDDKLKPLREQIDAIDAQLLKLLNERAKVAQQVGHVKAETNAPVFRPEREAQVLAALGRRPMTPEDLVPEVYSGLDPAAQTFAARTMLAHLLKLEREERVARDRDSWHIMRP